MSAPLPPLLSNPLFLPRSTRAESDSLNELLEGEEFKAKWIQIITKLQRFNDVEYSCCECNDFPSIT